MCSNDVWRSFDGGNFFSQLIKKNFLRDYNVIRQLKKEIFSELVDIRQEHGRKKLDTITNALHNVQFNEKAFKRL